MTVGERIKARREELHLSQGDLAKLMNVSRQAISKAELHDNNITTDKVRKFASALGVSESYLMGWGTESDPMQQGIEDANLVVMYHKLNPTNRKIITSMINTLLDSQDK